MFDRLHRAFVGAVAVAFVVAGPAAHAAEVSLSESGSTLLYPLFQSWVAGYKKVAPDVTLTAAATGSGAGIKDAIAGTVRIGASDAYVSDAVAAHNPQILDIPLAISALTINYNLPGMAYAHLKIDGPTLAAIYRGTVTQWDDPTLKAINPGVALPHRTIVPIRRADGSGDTFVFTQFLDFSAESWQDNPGFGTDIAWPKVAAEKAATGNTGVVEALAATPDSIGYVGVSYAKQIAEAKLHTAVVKNQNGKFLLPTPQTIAAGAAELDPRTPPYERISLVFAPGDDSYPLVNYEYVMVSNAQPDGATTQALSAFLRWAISATGGNSEAYLAPVGFIPLPDFVRGLSEAQIARIK